MKSKLLSIAFLLVTMSQAACLTTIHTKPLHHHRHAVHTTHTHHVHVPPPRPRPTVVTVRRY